MSTLNETKQSENGIAHMLTEGERNVMKALHMRVVQAKAQAWDAHAELTAAQQSFDGGLGMIANASGVGGGQLTPDFAAIIKQ